MRTLIVILVAGLLLIGSAHTIESQVKGLDDGGPPPKEIPRNAAFTLALIECMRLQVFAVLPSRPLDDEGTTERGDGQTECPPLPPKPIFAIDCTDASICVCENHDDCDCLNENADVCDYTITAPHGASGSGINCNVEELVLRGCEVTRPTPFPQ